jgi:oligopeptide transport system substrate-binding protein
MPSVRSKALALACALAAARVIAMAQAKPEPETGQVPTELVVAFNELDFELDPHRSIYSAEAQIFTAIYEGLFSYDPSTLDPVKAACRSYTRSQDSKTYTFTIREDAKWSDGTSLMARDFRESWLRALAPERKADYAAFFDIIRGARDFRTGKSKDPSSVGIEALNDKILQVTLTSRADYFTRLLCHHSFSPIHPSMVGKEDWIEAASQSPESFPVNGPYRLTEVGRDEMSLSADPGYWDAGSVSIKDLRFIFTDEDAEVTRRFDDGGIHWLAGPMDIDSLLDRDSIQVNPMFGTHYWFFDCSSSPWSDPGLRRALALLLPWDEIRSKENYLIPAQTLVLPFSGYEEAKGISAADEDEARRLLAASGHEGGSGLPPLVILVPDGEDAKRISTLMEGAWETLPELKVERKIVPSTRYFELVRAGPAASGYTIAMTTWIGDFADPLAFLQMWTSDSNLNDAGLADKEFDRLLAASAAKEGQDRLAALAVAETRLLSGAAVLPVYHSLAANIIDTDFVMGWYANALDIHPFKYLAFGERRIRPNVASVPYNSLRSTRLRRNVACIVRDTRAAKGRLAGS